MKQAAMAAVIAAGLSAVCSCDRGNRITGTLDMEGGDSLEVYVYDAVTNELAARDTIVAVNGKAGIDIKRDEDRMMFVYIVPIHQVTAPSPVFLLPGDRLRISGKKTGSCRDQTRLKSTDTAALVSLHFGIGLRFSKLPSIGKNAAAPMLTGPMLNVTASL